MVKLCNIYCKFKIKLRKVGLLNDLFKNIWLGYVMLCIF